MLSSSGEGFGDRHRHRGRRSHQISGLGSDRVTSWLWHFVAALIKMLTFANCVCRTQTCAGASNVTDSEVTAHMCRQGWQEAEQPQRPLPAGASLRKGCLCCLSPAHAVPQVSPGLRLPSLDPSPLKEAPLAPPLPFLHSALVPSLFSPPTTQYSQGLLREGPLGVLFAPSST